MPHRIRIQPVADDSGRAIKTIMHALGSGNREHAKRLVKAGGVAASGLDRRAAERIASVLKTAGVQASVERDDASAASGLTVRVLDRASNEPVVGARVAITGGGEVFASGTTDSAGEAAFEHFAARVHKTFGNERPEIAAQVRRQGQLVEVTHKPFKWKAFDAAEGAFTLQILAAAPEPGRKDAPAGGDRFAVHGRVALENGEPATGVTVRAFDRDLRSEQPLGQPSITGDDGFYGITYTADAFRRAEKGRADIRLRVYNAAGRELDANLPERELDTLFNAGADERLDLRVTGQAIRLSTYERLQADVTPLLEEVAWQDLTADDLRFLHHDTGHDLRTLGFIADDARLRAKTSLPEGVLFGLAMREMGTIQDAERGAPRIDLATLLDRSVDALTKAAEAAVDAVLVPIALRSQMETVHARFAALKENNRTEGPARRAEHARALGHAAGLDEESAANLGKRLAGGGPPTEQMWTQFVEEGVVGKNQLADVRLTFEFGDLTGQDIDLVNTITSASLPHIDGPVRTSRDLAALDANDWRDVLDKHDIAPPDGCDRQSYARQIAWHVERRHPTPVFAARTLRIDRLDVAKRLKRVQPLLASNKGLFTRLVSQRARQARDADEHGDDLQELAGLARAFAHLGVPEVLDRTDLAPPDKAEQIEERIQAMGKFFANNAELDLRSIDLIGLQAPDENGAPAQERTPSPSYAGIDKSLRLKVRRQAMAYQRAMAVAPHAEAATKLLRGGFSSAYDVAKLPLRAFASQLDVPFGEAVGMHVQATLDADRSNFAAGTLMPLLPDVRVPIHVDNVDDNLINKLRQLDSYEELFGSQAGCDCAHCRSIFGPLAYFVDLMAFVEANFLSVFASDDHPIHLKTRRPDLWNQLELSCANATELVPYLDIVNQVLTGYVAKVEEVTPQGEQSVETAVFALFSGGDRSFDQPVNLPLEELRAGMQRLDLDLPEAIARAGGDDAAKTRAWLKLSPEEVSTVTTSIADDEGALRRRYGVDDAADLTTLSPCTLMAVAGLTREELGRLAELDFVDGGSGDFAIVAVREDQALQPSHEEVRGLNAQRLDRLFRFVRLWRALPWTLEALDHVIAMFDRRGRSSRLDNSALEAMAALLRLQDALDLSVEQACALVDEIPTRSLQPETPSLYDRLFNQDVFVNRGERFEPDASRPFHHPYFDRPPTAEEGNDPALPRLLSAFDISEEAFVDLMSHLRGVLNPVEVVPEGGGRARSQVALTTGHLTLLYRHALIARKRGLSMDELFEALDLTQSQVPPFLAGEKEANALLAFLAWTRDAGLATADVAFATGKRAGASEQTFNAKTADALAAGAEKQVWFTLAAFNEISGLEQSDRSALRQALVDAGRIAEASSETGVYRLTTAHDATTPPQLPNEALRQRKDAVLDVLNHFLPEVHAAEALTEALAITPARLRALNAIVTGSFAAHERALSRTQGLTLTSSATTEADLLAYLAPLEETVRATERLGLTDQAVAFAAQHPTLYQLEGGTDHPLGQEALRRLAAYARLRGRFAERVAELETLVTDALLGQRFAQQDVSVQKRLAGELALLTQASPELAQSIFLQVPTPTGAVGAVAALVEALDLARTLRTSGTGLAQIRSTRYQDLAKARDQVYSALHARYDGEEQRKAALKPMQDRLRSRKRDVLMSHVVARPELNFNDPNDLYYYFLLDTKMEGCAQTSRVVAATASLQLYVHRCFMHLEQTAEGVSPDQRIHVWPAQAEADKLKAEWEWRKNYRVWEANRKIFLYPENYLEPDLRDNKTPPFKALEDQLMQEDLDQAAAARLYRGYLDSYDEVASLRIAGAYFEPFSESSAQGTVYVVGRTPGQPTRIYLRTQTQAGGRWSAWERIDVEMHARAVSPIIHLNRLYLFWVETETKPKYAKTSGDKNVFWGYRHTVKLKFTTRTAQGGWTAPQEVALSPKLGTVEDPLISGSAPLHQRADLPQHVDSEEGVFYAAPRDDYTLDARLYNRIFPLTHQGRLYFQYGDEATIYRLDIRAREAVEASSDALPAADIDRYGGYSLATVRKVMQENWLDLPSHFRQYHETVPAFLMRGVTFDRLRYYYESEKARTQAFDYPEQNAPALSLGTVPFGSKLQSVNNAPHLWIFESEDGAALLRRSGEATITGDRLRTRVAADLQIVLFREGLWSMLSTRTQFQLRENRLFGDQRYVGAPVATGGVGVFTPYHDFKTYNWEVFFHAPLLIANTLNARARYEEAERWYNVVFDPTGEEMARGHKAKLYYPNDRNWRFRALQQLDVPKLRELLASPEAYKAYREDPFNPHAVARDRPTAYQRGVVMKYVDNLLDWGDQLFTRDTRESINEARLLYIKAADILGKRPATLGTCETPAPETTYASLDVDDGFIVTVENMLHAYDSGQMMTLSFVPYDEHDEHDEAGELASRNVLSARGDDARGNAHLVVSGGAMSAAEGAGGFAVRGSTLVTEILQQRSLPLVRQIVAGNWYEYLRPDISGLVKRLVPFSPDRPVFCFPRNDNLLSYWDRVEDRLFKIRNCMNIEGVQRSLALFEPPIDPALLARASAAGLTLDEVLGAAAGERSQYRFSYLIGKAKDYVSTLRGLGSALLTALEKKDAQELAELRAVHTQNVQRMTKKIRRQQIESAQESVRSLQDQKARVDKRKQYLGDKIKEGRNEWENTSLALSSGALASHAAASIVAALAAPARATPEFEVGYASLGGFATVEYGGQQVGGTLDAAAQILRDVTAGLNMGAGIASTLGGQARRQEEWEHQHELTGMELEKIDKDIAASEIRVAIAQRELEVHETQMEQTEELYQLYKSRFSNLGLYTWLSSEVKGLYRHAYRMALEMARMAETAYQYERDETTTFIEPDVWDAEHAGLLSGEKLMMQLQEMDKAFLESNQRDYEVNQTFSLGQINPKSFHELRQNGSCEFLLPEPFFDVTYPGQYRRRIKSVRLTVPCVTGPYVNVNAKLTLLQGRVRQNPNADLVTEPRARNMSIATSQAQNDGGVFELSFRDERYVPFEGAGAADSEWRLELPAEFRSFDYDTISDVAVHVAYTAKEDGEFRKTVEGNLRDALNSMAAGQGISRGLSLSQEFTNGFNHLFRSRDGDNQTVSVRIDHRHFPYFLHSQKLKLKSAIVALKLHEPWDRQYPPDGAGPLSATLRATEQGQGQEKVLNKGDNGVTIPNALYDLSGANVGVDATGLSLSLEIATQDFINLYKALRPEAEDHENAEPAPEDLREIIEDIYLVPTVKIE